MCENMGLKEFETPLGLEALLEVEALLELEVLLRLETLNVLEALLGLVAHHGYLFIVRESSILPSWIISWQDL